MLDVHFRIYDKSRIEKFEYILSTRHIKKNPLSCELCCLAIDEEYQRLIASKDLEFEISQQEVQLETARELLNSMKDAEINNQIQTKMLSVIYQVLIKIMNKEIIDSKSIEGGMYDDLPERFVEMLDTLVFLGD